MTEHTAGICPLCGSDDIDYDSLEMGTGMSVYYPAFCNNCKGTFKEFYSLEFAEHIDIEKAVE